MGASVSFNEIGANGGQSIKAFIDNSTVTASGGVSLSSVTTANVNALGIGGAGGLAASSTGLSVSIAAAGAAMVNSIQQTVTSSITGGSTVNPNGGDLTLTATDHSTIDADAVGAAIAVAGSGGGAAAAISVGISIAQNTIGNHVGSFITSTNPINAKSGAIHLTTGESSQITAHSTAASVSVAAAQAAGVALAGGGAVALNVITSDALSYVQNTNLQSSGDTTLAATNTSKIDATIVAVAAAVGGGQNGVAAAIGASVAENSIGYDQGGGLDSADTEAYVLNSSVNAGGKETLTAISSQTINATVVAASVAVAAGSGVGVAVAGSGVYAQNMIAGKILAYHDGDGTGAGAGIHATSITASAGDTSSITALAGAASLAGVTRRRDRRLGLDRRVLAMNQIDNDVEAYIANAGHGVSTSTGDIVLITAEDATIHATSFAASLAASFSGGVAVGISGAGPRPPTSSSARTTPTPRAATSSAPGP